MHDIYHLSLNFYFIVHMYPCLVIDTIRIYHECEGWIEKSAQWTHIANREACQSLSIIHSMYVTHMFW